MATNNNDRMKIDMDLLGQADRQASMDIDNFEDLKEAVESILGHGCGQLLVGQIRRWAGKEDELLAVEGPPSAELVERLGILIISGFIWGWRYRQLEQDQQNGNGLVNYTIDNFMEC